MNFSCSSSKFWYKSSLLHELRITRLIKTMRNMSFRNIFIMFLWFFASLFHQRLCFQLTFTSLLRKMEREKKLMTLAYFDDEWMSEREKRNFSFSAFVSSFSQRWLRWWWSFFSFIITDKFSFCYSAPSFINIVWNSIDKNML